MALSVRSSYVSFTAGTHVAIHVSPVRVMLWLIAGGRWEQHTIGRPYGNPNYTLLMKILYNFPCMIDARLGYPHRQAPVTALVKIVSFALTLCVRQKIPWYRFAGFNGAVNNPRMRRGARQGAIIGPVWMEIELSGNHEQLIT
ncbi:hypothetical protein [uncultured Methylobacterium sp.]|uniref:hypothetical protein n=1 Tax=uncultured Methylobacterium sp. TaxID=157278 RepID=UPI0035CC9718